MSVIPLLRFTLSLCHIITFIKAPPMKDTIGQIAAAKTEFPRITVIYDNYSYRSDLETSWGFSCYIEGKEENILFDTGGDGDILYRNMAKLNIMPDRIQTIVLSHEHGDHIGGLERILKENPHVRIFVPQSFSQKIKKMITTAGAQAIDVEEPCQIGDQVFSSGEIKGNIPEQALIIKTMNGLIVITGCAHPGIIAILRRVRQLYTDDFLLVLGGFHLKGLGKNQIQNLIEEIRELGVHYIGATHCSGELTRSLFAQSFNDYWLPAGVGYRIELSDLIIPHKH
ncbi:MAG: MBL fold metallo-hydrolase [Calditrichaeota bacterium]|nr:MAG: MBL fold metallo-hydrolase [Calditrichota bacterium]